MDANSDKAARYRLNAKNLRTMALGEKDVKLSRALSLLAEDYEAMAITQGAIDRSNAERMRANGGPALPNSPTRKQIKS